MNGVHEYAVRVEWTGNRGTGTSHYKAYGRDHLISPAGRASAEKVPILGSSDSTFHGDNDRWNPEELLLAALSQCHLLSYLHVAVRNGITVTAYTDAPVGTMEQVAGGGHFTAVTLRPRVTITDPEQVEFAQSLHAEAALECFIAASVNFPVGHEPVTVA
ncbi:OsmC family peroxiredoxin [Cryobacterium levicorallinum]|uniref:Organic hydroperoxide reductase OsmC/OhrA n=1 Tax=Cryobacterium levicorallinum TaxID=995038 RepID=A0A1I3B7Y9_9MICO|nr:OsmC family protein [Cryobacterium levicorallinum]TFB83400.1 OsmC family peroxiredoxin [Cryobacterium levicorallinum]GEP26916.1 peroxiredoxin [Cryobacterium levicorallinum]SFH58342.1 Organic hydroperoxide reductase OsmC/OhrA [Cryobacterium levicorallinum]